MSLSNYAPYSTAYDFEAYDTVDAERTEGTTCECGDRKSPDQPYCDSCILSFFEYEVKK